MSHLQRENTSFQIFMKYIQKRRFWLKQPHNHTHHPMPKVEKKAPGMIFMHYTPIPTLPDLHPGIHIHIHTSSHPPIIPSLRHPHLILDIGICPSIQEHSYNISMSITCCPIDRSVFILCISIYTMTGEGKRPMEGGGREEREGWEWDV